MMSKLKESSVDAIFADQAFVAALKVRKEKSTEANQKQTVALNC